MSESPEMNHLEPGDRELERALESLRPATPAVPRDEIFYRAGYDAGKRDAHQQSRGGMLFWRFAAGSMSALAAGLALLMFLRSGTPPEPRIMYVEQDRKTEPRPPAGATQFVRDDREGGSGDAAVAGAALPSGWFRLTPWLSLPEWGVAQRPPFATAQTLPAASSPDEGPVLRRLRFERNLGVSAEDVGGAAAYRFVTRHVNDTFGEGSL